MSWFTFWIFHIKDVRVSSRNLLWMSTNIISFFSEIFTVKISTPVEYSTINGFLALWEKASKRHLTSKNAVFWRIRDLFAWYLGFVTKNLIDTLSNLQIINIGQIGRLIQNWKFVIFPMFIHFSQFLAKIFQSYNFNILRLSQRRRKWS